MNTTKGKIIKINKPNRKPKKYARSHFTSTICFFVALLFSSFPSILGVHLKNVNFKHFADNTSQINNFKTTTSATTDQQCAETIARSMKSCVFDKAAVGGQYKKEVGLLIDNTTRHSD